MAGASPAKGDQTLIVIDNGFERRYFYSATTATRGLGWLGKGEVKVYRLDEEATTNLKSALSSVPKTHDPKTGNRLKATKENFMNLFEVYTGIRRS